MALLDENFIYLIQDIIYDENEPSLRRIGKSYDLKALSSINIKNIDKGHVMFNLIFILNKDVDKYLSKLKEIYFDNFHAHVFKKYLDFYLNKLNIPVNPIGKIN